MHEDDEDEDGFARFGGPDLAAEVRATLRYAAAALEHAADHAEDFALVLAAVSRADSALRDLPVPRLRLHPLGVHLAEANPDPISTALREVDRRLTRRGHPLAEVRRASLARHVDRRQN
ncbi:MAG: hypothetical protein MUF83_21160 [Acidimicrobiales bacterium]|jgi:hypothetical protein|nr:hypothetical protein [Acidimicrobiales bacterium]